MSQKILDYTKPFKTQGLNPIRDTEVYTVTDNNYLDNLVVSETVLHPDKNTNGHAHVGLDEVYIFNSGVGVIQIDEMQFDVKSGTVISVKGGEFHKVFNISSTEDLSFVAIFQKYERDS